MIDDESLVKTRTNTCLSGTSGIPFYSVLRVSTGLEWTIPQLTKILNSTSLDIISSQLERASQN